MSRIRLRAVAGTHLAWLGFALGLSAISTDSEANPLTGVAASQQTAALFEADERAPRSPCDPELQKKSKGGANGYGDFGEVCQGYLRELSATEPIPPISLRSLYIVPDSAESLDTIAESTGERLVWVSVPVAEQHTVMILIQAGTRSPEVGGFRKTWAMTACRSGPSPELLWNRLELQDLMTRRPQVDLGALAFSPSSCAPAATEDRFYVPVGFAQRQGQSPGSSFEAVVDFHPKPASQPTFRVLGSDGSTLDNCQPRLELAASLELHIRCPLPRCRALYSLQIVVEPTPGIAKAFSLFIGRENCRP